MVSAGYDGDLIGLTGQEVNNPNSSTKAARRAVSTSALFTLNDPIRIASPPWPPRSPRYARTTWPGSRHGISGAWLGDMARSTCLMLWVDNPPMPPKNGAGLGTTSAC